jgi:integrase
MLANKTLETTREVPVSPTLNPFIEEHLRTLGDPEEETPLFTMPTGEKGRLFGRNTLLNAFKQAQKPLGLNYSFHDTRSYALTHIGKNSAVGRGDLMALSGITNSRTLDRYTKTTGLEEITEQLDFF